MILIWAASFILFHIVCWNVTEHYWTGLTFSLILFVTSFNHAMKLLQNTVAATNKQAHCFILLCSLTIAAAVI
jgi:membrane protein CcdC involved in cytochrome C biogenesis